MGTWKKINSVTELKAGQQIAFTTKQDEKVTEVWNERFTLLACIPNTDGKIEMNISTGEGERLVVYTDEIDSIYVYQS